jgi:hypothetical protein
VLAEDQPGVDAVFQGQVTGFGEAGRGRYRPRLRRELGQRVALPQRQGLLEVRDRGAGITGPELVTALPGQELEPQRVNLVIRGPQQVSGILRHQHLRGRAGRPTGFQHPPQLGDVSLQRGGGGPGRLVVPEQADEAVHRDHVPGLHHQDGQQRALQPRAERYRLPVPVRAEGAEHGELQASRQRVFRHVATLSEG